MHGDNELLKMMSMHAGDWPLPPGVVRPTLPPIPVVRSAAVPGAAAAAQPGSAARPGTGSAALRSEFLCERALCMTALPLILQCERRSEQYCGAQNSCIA